MGILDGQAVSAAVTNPAFINKNIDDTMSNILGLNRGLSGPSIADIQAAANRLYTATGASEVATGTVYNATAGTITNGSNYQTALNVLAGKFDPATGHFHTGAAGDGPVLDYVLDIAVTGNTPAFGSIILTAGSNVDINQSGNNFVFSASGGLQTIAVTGNAGVSGNIILIPGNNMSITQAGNNFTFASSGGGAGGAVITFNFANNQVSPADVTGFLTPPASGSVWVSETSIVRNVPAYVVVTDAEDTAFYTNLGSGFNDVVRFPLELSDGTILLSGDFTTFNGNSRNYLVKTTAAGVEDTGFYTNLGTSANNPLYSLAEQSDTAILVAGQFTSFNGNTTKSLVRISALGVEDSSFTTNLGTGFNPTGTISVAVQTDQKIIVGGVFTTLNGNPAYRLVRLNTNGSEDTTFTTNLGTGFDNQVFNVAIQSDQKILVCGQFTDLNGNTRNGLVRINTDGTEDSSFYTNLGTGFNAAPEFIKVQPDQSILVGGNFTTLNGTTRNRFVKLNSDGTVDTTFYGNLGTAFGNVVLQISLQSTGKIIAVGLFTSFNGNTRNRIVRLNSDGTEDTAFYTSVGTAFNAQVFSVSTQVNDQLLIGGNFTTFNGNSRVRMIRYETVANFAAQNLVSAQTLKGVYHAASGGSWTLGSYASLGDVTGLSFTMSNAGQLQYTSSNLSGTPSLNQMKFEILEL